MKQIIKTLIIFYCCLVPQFLFAAKSISGITLDEGTQKPLIGVSITVKGNELLGTTSGLDGTFELDIPENAGTIIFTYIGYQSKELPVDQCQNSTIQLRVSATLLDEILVVGYGTQVRSDMTGNVSKINKEDIGMVPVKSLESVLQWGLVVPPTSQKYSNHSLAIPLRSLDEC